MKFLKRCAVGLFCLLTVVTAGSLLAQETGVTSENADRLAGSHCFVGDRKPSLQPTIGTPISMTGTPAPWDADPTRNPLGIGFDFHFGMKARGMGTPGFSRVYASFTSTADRPGAFNGQPLPEQNNNLQKLTY
jgi:hypothetical protein